VKQFPVVLVTGARQTGKTSLLRHCFQDAEYVTLDDPALALRVKKRAGGLHNVSRHAGHHR
jgi:predicted AAA+ superfamily ATPase